MTFDYDVVFSARRSVSINISPDNRITVRCPYGYDRRKIENLLIKKSAWINKHLSFNAQLSQLNGDFASYEYSLVKGEKLPLVIGEKNVITPQAVYVKNLKNLKKLYLGALLPQFSARFNHFSEITGLKASSVNFKSYTARWGCCNVKNEIIFNYKLLMLDESLWDYVIVHELCHIKIHNHSKSFWALVEKFLPQYEKSRKRLKSFGFITSLY